MTPPEIALWLALRRNDAGLRFRRQYPADAYVLDFYCAPAKLAVEVDGEAHNRGDRPMIDAARDAWLASQGVRTLRYPATEVLSNLDGVVCEIMMVAIERRDGMAGAPRPPPPSACGCHLPLAGEDDVSSIGGYAKGGFRQKII